MKNRNLWQILALYAGASWVVLQVVDVVKQNLGLPDWVFPFALLLLLIGMPIIVATALVQGRQVPAAASNEFAGDEPATSVSPRSDDATRRLFTWRNALLGGGLAFVLLAIVTGGFMFMRDRGIGPVGSLVASGLLEEKAAIVVADFTGEDPSLTRAATQAFRVDLSQSELVKLVEPATLDDALARMELPEDQALTPDVAYDLAVREGYPAVIEGELTSVGDGYVLTARLADARSQETLASLRETAANANEIIPAIDRLSGKMREKIGDSYSSMRADEPLEQVTTGSLEALEKYSRALELFAAGTDHELGVDLLEEAVAIDSAFAMAWRKLGVELTGDRAREIEAIENAYRHRDRLTERERLLAEAQYYLDVEADPRKTISVYERLVDLDPSDSWALNNLGASYVELGEWEEAEHWVARSVAVDSTVKSLTNVALTQIQQGKLDEAEATLAIADRIAPGNERNLLHHYALAANRQDWVEAETWARQMQATTDPAWAGTGTFQLASLAAIRGNLAEAEALWREAIDEQKRAGALVTSGPLFQVFDINLDVRADTSRALGTLEEILEIDDLESLDPLNRPYLRLAGWFARAGDRAEAQALLDRFEAEVPEAYRTGRSIQQTYQFIDATLALAEGAPAEALQIHRSLDTGGCQLCGFLGPAKAFEAMGKADSAIAYYEGYLNASSVQRAAWDNENLGPTYERLAQLYDEKGDLETASVYYARLVELWQEADAELQPRVRAAQARLEEIVRERG
ncbi:MAG: tetratricopeptide repeat protein [marine benthic group bacterium]|nr:tetratricopeptide repeat protein [Gemmatimonadota bacterium]